MKTKYAFVIIHFGDKVKYLELEIYTSIMLKKNTNHDIIYLYSINDTPKHFINIMKQYCTHTIPYDDNNITYNITDFTSIYEHFNTIRTCNFLFAFNLTQYEKICIVESDIIIMRNIDDIFDLKAPASVCYYDKNKENKHLFLENYKINLDNKYFMDECRTKSYMNGGVILLKPSLAKYKTCLTKLKLIIKKNVISVK